MYLNVVLIFEYNRCELNNINNIHFNDFNDSLMATQAILFLFEILTHSLIIIIICGYYIIIYIVFSAACDVFVVFQSSFHVNVLT